MQRPATALAHIRKWMWPFIAQPAAIVSVAKVGSYLLVGERVRNHTQSRAWKAQVSLPVSRHSIFQTPHEL